MALVTALVVVLVVLGKRVSRASDQEKIAVLRGLDGHKVRLGLARGGHVWVGFPMTGRLRVGDSYPFVTLVGRKERLVALGQVLWVVDLDTGQRFGGRRWTRGEVQDA